MNQTSSESLYIIKAIKDNGYFPDQMKMIFTELVVVLELIEKAVND